MPQYPQRPASYPQRNPINPTQQRDAITSALMSIARPQPQVRMPLRSPMPGAPMQGLQPPAAGGPQPSAAPQMPQAPMPMGSLAPNPMQS